MPAPEKPWTGRQHRRVAEIGQRQRQPVHLIVQQIEVRRGAQRGRDVQRLPHAPVHGSVLRVATRADAAQNRTCLRVQGREQRHLDAARYQALGQQAGDELPRTVMPRRSAPSDRRQHGHLHRGIPMRGLNRLTVTSESERSATHPPAALAWVHRGPGPCCQQRTRPDQ